MLRRVLMMLVLLVLWQWSFSQEQYRAVFAGGRIYLSEENRFSQIDNGQLIDSGAKLELVGNTLLVLMDNAGRLINLSLSGKYDLANLSMPDVADSSAFVKSVWDTYYALADEDISVEEELLRAAALETETFSLELPLPSSSQVFGNQLLLEWDSPAGTGYSAELINEFNEVFKSTDLNSASLELDLFTKDLVWKREVSIKILTKDGSLSPVYTLDKLSPPDYERMDRLVRKNFQDEVFTTLLTQAAFYENQWLFADAQTLLNRLKSSHGRLMDEYWKQYLLRNGFYAMSRE